MENIDSPFNENPNAPKFIPALTYGAIISLITITLMMIATWTGWDMNGMGYKASVWIASIAALVLCIKDYRDKHNNKKLRIGQSVSLSLLIGIVSGVIGAVFFYFYMTYINPDFMDAATDQAIQQMHEKGLSDEQIAQQMEFVSFFMSPGFITGMMILFTIIFDLIAGLVIGAILKRD
jgi:hypothetical protein